MTIEYICGVVAELTEKHGERNPHALAVAMGVITLFEPMGKGEKSCKGFYMHQSRKDLITVNSDLSDEARRIILAHELGHAALHRDLVRQGGFHDFSLWDAAAKPEYEANLFAAELLLEDGEVLELLRQDNFFFSAAGRLGVPPELLDFKLRILKRKGCKFESPIRARGDFLKGRL